jgi:magnesium chelatase family protein
VRARAARAREVALARQGKPNAALAGAEVDAHCAVDAGGRSLLGAAVERLDLSARALPRLLKLARTIADLAGAAGLAPAHVAEAIGYRRWG